MRLHSETTLRDMTRLVNILYDYRNALVHTAVSIEEGEKGRALSGYEIRLIKDEIDDTIRQFQRYANNIKTEVA